MFRFLLPVCFAFSMVLGGTLADNATIPVVIWHGMGEFLYKKSCIRNKENEFIVQVTRISDCETASYKHH